MVKPNILIIECKIKSTHFNNKHGSKVCTCVLTPRSQMKCFSMDELHE